MALELPGVPCLEDSVYYVCTHVFVQCPCREPVRSDTGAPVELQTSMYPGGPEGSLHQAIAPVPILDTCRDVADADPPVDPWTYGVFPYV
jgi:hypothetical protein